MNQEEVPVSDGNCNNCDAKLAEYECLDCGEYLCQQCTQWHEHDD